MSENIVFPLEVFDFGFWTGESDTETLSEKNLQPVRKMFAGKLTVDERSLLNAHWDIIVR